MAILSGANDQEIGEFAKDLFLVMNAMKNIDQEYAAAKQEFIQDFAHFKKLLSEWNKKYPGLTLIHYEDGMQIKLRVVIKDSMENVMIASLKIEGAQSVNGREIPVGSEQELVLLNKNTDRLEIVYENEAKNSLDFELNNGGIRLVYEEVDMSTKNSPEFQICAFYALRKCNPNVNLQRFSSYFCFDTGFAAREGQGDSYQDRVRLFDRI